jgi:hypothetical protein
LTSGKEDELSFSGVVDQGVPLARGEVMSKGEKLAEWLDKVRVVAAELKVGFLS